MQPDPDSNPDVPDASRDPQVPGVVHLRPPGDPVRAYWEATYAETVANAGMGAPTATSHTFRWARDEVEWGIEHGCPPERGVPSHWDD